MDVGIMILSVRGSPDIEYGLIFNTEIIVIRTYIMMLRKNVHQSMFLDRRIHFE